MTSRPACLVLAGGRSRRMGRDKASLPWGDTTLADWQCARLAGLGWPVHLAGRGGIADRHDDFRGPLAGIEAACRAQPDIDLWLVVAVDMPAISLASLERLSRQARATGRATAFLDHPLPLALPVDAALRTRLDRWLADPAGPRAVADLFAATGGAWLAGPDDPEELSNLNTPEDWRHFRRATTPPGAQNP